MHAFFEFLSDLRQGFRGLAQRPQSALAGASVAALGIGCSLAVLGLAHGMLVAPLPFPESARIFSLSRTTPSISRSPVSVPELLDWRERNRSFSALAMVRPSSFTYRPAGEPAERLPGLMVSWSLFGVLGVEPLFGRGFAADDDRAGADPVAVLSHAVWQSSFGGDPTVVGRVLDLNGRGFVVVGILPPALDTCHLLPEAASGGVWVPISLVYDRITHAERAIRPDIFVLGRPKPEVDLATARGDMDRVAAELEAAYPLTNHESAISIKPLREELLGSARQGVWVLLATAGLVMVMTIVNLGNLLLTGVIARQRELATRLAIGATRRRIASLLIAEALALALVGTLLGIPLALAGGPLLRGLIPSGFDVSQMRLGWSHPVWWTALPLVLLMCTLTTLPSIWLATGQRTLRSLVGPSDLAGQTRGGRALRHALVALQIALAAALLVSAGLLVASAAGLQDIDPGFDAESVLTMHVAPDADGDRTQAEMLALFDRWIHRIEALPGVERAAITSVLPFDAGTGGLSRIVPRDRPTPRIPDMDIVSFAAVTPGFFASLGIEIVAGRDFDSGLDRPAIEPPAAIISRSIARAYWGDAQAALGHAIAFELIGTPADFSLRNRTVVGVIEDVRFGRLDQSETSIFAPMTQLPTYYQEAWPVLGLVIDSQGAPETLTAAVRDTVAEVSPGIPLFGIEILGNGLRRQSAPVARLASVVRAFACIALALAAAGIFGVTAASVASERREIGVRSALGALPRQILAGYLARAAMLVAAGLALGMAVALAVAPKILGSILFSVPPRAPAHYLAASAVLALIAMAAAFLPALRATRVPPTEALRNT